MILDISFAEALPNALKVSGVVVAIFLHIAHFSVCKILTSLKCLGHTLMFLIVLFCSQQHFNVLRYCLFNTLLVQASVHITCALTLGLRPAVSKPTGGKILSKHH